MKVQTKYLAIERFVNKYSVCEMCCFFGVSRSGYYAFLKRKTQPDKDALLGELIRKCQQSTKFTYGYRRIKLWLLRETGLVINHKAVLRIMGKYNLLSQIRRVRQYHSYGEYLQQYPNMLQQNFSASSPNRKWVTDISFIKTGQGVLYLSIIKDLHDGFIVSYRMSARNNNQLVLQTLEQAKKQVADGLILHSDQGFQYASTAYMTLTKEYGISPSMSRAGTPLDNAPAESFFAVLKTECIYRRKIQSFAQAKTLISRFIYFYNYQRIQLRTKLTPYEKRCQLQ